VARRQDRAGNSALSLTRIDRLENGWRVVAVNRRG